MDFDYEELNIGVAQEGSESEYYDESEEPKDEQPESNVVKQITDRIDK